MDMNHSEFDSSQPLLELEWLAHFFKKYGHHEVAKEIAEQIQLSRRRAQDSRSAPRSEKNWDQQSRDR